MKSNRRSFLALPLALSPALARATDIQPIRVGMSTALSGPAQGLGTGMKAGVEAYFKLVNQRGGVGGRPVELVALDDEYEPAKTGPNVRRLIDQDDVAAIVGNVGTPTAVVTVPIVNAKKVPFFGAFTGAGVLRKSPPDQYVFNLRASYAEETAEMIRGLLTERRLQPEEIAFFTQDDSYGDAGFNGAVKALAKHGFTQPEKLAHGRYTRNTLDVEDGLATILDPRHSPRAVIMVGTYKPCAKFIRLAKQHGLKVLFANVSFVGSADLKRELAELSEGVVITQVVPHWSGNLPIMEEYRASGLEASFVSLEGFIVGRAYTEILRHSANANLREGFVEAAESGALFDLGWGQTRALSATVHSLSSAVWPTIIRGNEFSQFSDWSEATT
jgi:branched-chain amino acid transport system substrate-binding protein